MTSNPTLDYPAEYYFPEFLESRPDDPLKISKSNLPITKSIDNGVGTSTKMPASIEKKVRKSPTTKSPPLTTVATNVAIDHGLPDADMTKSLRTDPKKNLLRDPASRNIPRLIVDDNIIKQSMAGSKVIITDRDNDLEQTKKINPKQPKPRTPATSVITADELKDKTKHPESFPQYPANYMDYYGPYGYGNNYYPPTVYIDNQQTVDEKWKKQVVIDKEGVVTIEPMKYDKESYEGPFGLTRKGATIFYLVTSIFTLLCGVFLILSGIFYAQNYPSESSRTGTLTAMCGLAFGFYIGLQLILIGIWHQKYRYENPKKIHNKPSQHDDSSTRLKSAMEADERYNYSYQKPSEYPSYDYYPSPPYVSNVNEQMLLKQPGAATGTYYDPVVWPSNVQIDTKMDPKFYQSMESSYGQPESNSLPAASKNPVKSDKQKTIGKPVQATPPKAKFDNLFPNSTVVEKPLPKLSKAPETNDLMRAIETVETTVKKPSPTQRLKKRHSNRIRPRDRDYGESNRRSPRRHRQRRRSDSYSSCSTCSSSSFEELTSNVNQQPYQTKYPETKSSVVNAVTTSKSNPATHHDNHYGTGTTLQYLNDSSSSTIFGNTSNTQTNHRETDPIVRRTVIVKSNITHPTSEVTTYPNNTNTIQKTSTKTNNYDRMAGIHIEDINDRTSGNKTSNNSKTLSTKKTSSN